MDLSNKIQVTQARIMEWYNRNDKKCYISFSGGKDSTVLKVSENDEYKPTRRRKATRKQ